MDSTHYTEKGKFSLIDEQAIKTSLKNSAQINPIISIIEHNLGVTSLSYNENTQELLSGAFDGIICSYDVNSLKCNRKYREHKAGIWTIAHSQISNNYASGGSDNDIYLWDSKSKSNTSKLKFHEDPTYCLKFSDFNQDKLLSCSKGKIVLWDLKNVSQPLKIISNKEDKFVYSTNFISHDKYIVYGLIDGGITIIDAATAEEVTTCNFNFSKYKSEVNIDEFNSIYSINKTNRPLEKADDNVIITSHSDGVIRKFEFDPQLKVLSENFIYPFNWMPMTSAIESPSGNITLSSSKDHCSYIWKTNQNEGVDFQLIGHKDIVTSSIFINESLVATGSYDNSVCFWKI